MADESSRWQANIPLANDQRRPQWLQDDRPSVILSGLAVLQWNMQTSIQNRSVTNHSDGTEIYRAPTDEQSQMGDAASVYLYQTGVPKQCSLEQIQQRLLPWTEHRWGNPIPSRMARARQGNPWGTGNTLY